MVSDCPTCLQNRRRVRDLEDELEEWRSQAKKPVSVSGPPPIPTSLAVIMAVADTLRTAPIGRNRAGQSEARILLALLSRPGMTLARETVLSVARDGPGRKGAGRYGPDVMIKAVDVYVNRLRTSLRDLGQGEPITTVWGVGYTITREAAPALRAWVDAASQTKTAA